MNLRDLKPQQLKRIALEGENEFDQWFHQTGGTKFGRPNELVTPKDIWRTAYSKGASAVLRRISKLEKDD